MSIATPTTIRTEVPPNQMFCIELVNKLSKLGNKTMKIKNKASNQSKRFDVLPMNVDVGLPGLIPGTKPPFFCKLFAISIGLKEIEE